MTRNVILMTQSRIGSFFESIASAVIAAPTAMILHWYMLDIWGNDFETESIKQLFVAISWFSFLIHSIVWKFILRRVFEKYGIKLEPRFILNHIRGKYV